MNANGNSDAAQGKASSNSTIFTRSDRSESLRPDVETPVLKFFRTLSEETDTSPGNINSSHGTSVEVNGNEKTGGDSSAVGVVQKNGESTTPTTVVRANEREEVCGTEGCRELESVDWMPPGTSCSVDCDRNGGLAQWIPEAQSDIMDLEEKDANGPTSGPPPGTTSIRATFSLSSPEEKPLQLPALFSGLRVLKKGAAGPDQDIVALIKPPSPSDLGVNKPVRREQKMVRRRQGTFLDQLSQFLNMEKDDNKPSETLEPSEPKEPQKPPSSAEVAFDAFKAFFVPRPLRRDQDAVKRKAWIFERTFKTPEKKTDSKSRASTPGDGEDRSTPGRLQAIWPPTKEEKVGLKYTEAEHQAALLQLKRECNEEMEKIQEDFGKLLRQMRGDNEERVFHLECNLARLQSDLVLGAHHRRGDLRDVAVSTGDDLSPRIVHNVCVQTDRQTFIRTPEDEEGGVRLGLQPPLNTQGLDGPPPPPPPPPGCSPPPPPPPPGCSPPPPPPPPGCVPPPGGLNYSVLVDKPHRKPAVEPACLMKPLYWTRIQIQDKSRHSKDTLWNSLVEPDIINTTEFEDLFSKTTLQTKKKPLSEAYEKKAKAKKVIKLLDGKRSQAVGILISSLHLEMNDIQQAVLTVDNSVVDLETIQALYENRAQPDELERIKRHYHTSEEELVKLLDKPEQFLYELSQIPDFPGRASCIIFQSFFIDAIASVQRKVDIVSRVCKDLLETSSVREVMGLVLALGNHMNGGNGTRGQADGFGLEILPKLKDVKSRDNRISLVDYVVSYYLRNLDENAGTERSVFPLPEPQDVFLSAQVKFEDITKELSQLRRDLTVCEKDVQKVCSSSPDEHLQPFKDKMEAFVLNAHKEQDEMHAQLMFAQKSFHELVTFLGLKPKTGETEVATGHFFMLWFEFCTDFMTRWRRENKNISKERLKDAQLSVKKITADKKVETRKINPNSLKERLRQKEANMVATS
ncbi:formin-like [Salvelinus namaycush]|uniref:Formin-like n=1 Tax=Salvelinus namaycush TaxID=8040 RepID=A0A8U0PGH0_SALNM|nr:formin-like [Salvelinus namaycush]